MSRSLESLNPTAIQPVQRADAAVPANYTNPAAMVCDLAEGNAFWPGGNTPPLSVLNAFGADRLHQCRLEGSWDLERATSEDSHRLVRSYRELRIENASGEWKDLIFQLGPRAFLCADQRRIVGYASTHSEAERLVLQFTKNFGAPSPSDGSFHLIKEGSFGISTETVVLSTDTLLGEETLDLHYPRGTREWHQDFTNKLQARSQGLSIFEGAPGTGKTSYLRHLTGCLKESHRFYFIPPCRMHILNQPEFIDFWADQRRMHSSRKFIVIIEDSEALLMTRASDNRHQVSAILNLSDGMLADFLRLQIICTINCTASDLDQALLRPGRLLCHRVFDKLDYPGACRLAESLGRKLPVVRDYSLAEVFAGQRSEESNRPHIGFAA